MNIGLFTDPYYPMVDGVSNSVEMLRDELEALGHGVHVFTTTNPHIDRQEVNVHRSMSMPFFGLPSKRMGMPYHPMAINKVRSLKLDIFHTHTEFSMGTFGKAMARLAKKPLVHTYHTIYEDYMHYITRGKFDKTSKKAARVLSRIFCNGCDKLIVPTEKTRDLLTSYNVHTPIVTIPTGLPLERFRMENCDQDELARLRQHYGIGPEDKVILFVGRIAKEKQLEDIVEVMPEFMRDHAHVRFLLVGDGPWRGIIEELVNAKGIAQWVTFAGEQPYRTIGTYYHLGDVFINASRTETQGLTYLEAMAAGIPVLARADRCLDNVIVNGASGVTFEDMSELPEQLEKMLYDDAWRERILKGADAVVSDFSARTFAKRVESVYRDAMEQGDEVGAEAAEQSRA
ncbi:MAG: glycosyltransferase [Peptococcaceae bacterium]|nr:glycosyltransferase [Peptococcaceae bacterium]